MRISPATTSTKKAAALPPLSSCRTNTFFTIQPLRPLQIRGTRAIRRASESSLRGTLPRSARLKTWFLLCVRTYPSRGVSSSFSFGNRRNGFAVPESLARSLAVYSGFEHSERFKRKPVGAFVLADDDLPHS